MNDNAKPIKTPDRPASIALFDAIERAIDEIAPDKLTPIEVLGCLDLVGKVFYKQNFID